MVAQELSNTGRLHLRKLGNRKLATIIFSILFLWMLSPVFLPDDYSGYAGEEREMITKAVDVADVELGPIQRFSVESVAKYDYGWEVKFIHYTIFNIPVRESNITLVRSNDGFHIADGDFRDVTHFSGWIIWLSILLTYFIVFGFPALAIGYLLNKQWQLSLLLYNPKVYGLLGYILVSVPSLIFFFEGGPGTHYYPSIHATERIWGGAFQPIYLYLDFFGAAVAALGCYRNTLAAWAGSLFVLALSISLMSSVGLLHIAGAVVLLAGAALRLLRSK